MADASSFECVNDSEAFKTHEKTSKGGREMVLDIGVKPEIYPTDQTPTPIRLIRNCEEMGLFQDLQNVNPFEETFRKAAEDIRSGSSQLEISSLSAPSNNDDSLHTPHVVFPPLGESIRSQNDASESRNTTIIQQDAVPFGLSLDTEEPNQTVVQQEADTSEEAHLSDSDVGEGDEDGDGDDVGDKTQGTIQFLLRMPNGKMVQLSSLPVEHVNNPQSSQKQIPVITVDSSALRNVSEATASTDHSSISCLNSSNNRSKYSAGSLIVNVGQERIISSNPENLSKVKTGKAVLKAVSSRDSFEQASKMALAKQRLKQALMNNSCPAATPSTSAAAESHRVTTMLTTSKIVSVRRPSSTSDECSNRGSDNSFMEEKRRRNRAAAMRCREKRKTWVKELERRANDMLRTNGQLQYEVSLLRDEVAQLKTLLLAHRDCPVTQALVQGSSVLTAGKSSSAASQSTRISSSKASGKDASPQEVVLQTPSTVVKPVILLGDPPVKRKRLSSSSKPPASLGPVVSVPSVPQTYVISSVANGATKVGTVLNSSFVNVIPSVLVANTTSSSGTTSNAPVIALSVPTISSLPSNHFAAVHRQPFILPKADADSSSRDERTEQHTKHSKMRSGHILSTNVIKVNPNVVDRDDEDYDSDVEVIDIDLNSDLTSDCS